ncbi:hypothetical protein CA266_11620 [Serratia marcescens]|uniref:GapS6b family protein n=1 Tax=Serratia marcescens TaxID=615 RepID=UPI00187E9F6D|nr:hypothetical protein [Serratia marcescens]QOV56019.1 hypothetical protein CA266_11620 [Serratia marcescens]
MEKQIHIGSGDNVGNNKIVNITNSIEPKDIKGFIADFMHDILHRKISDAEKKIDSITNIDRLDSDVKSILNTLKIKIALLRGEKGLQKQEMQNLLRKKTLDCDVLDVVFSTLLHLESEMQLEPARERYLSAKAKGPYSNEVFFEYLSTASEVVSVFNSTDKFNFLEQEILGLIRGSIRNDNINIAYELSKHLHINYPSTSSTFFLLHCETLSFLKKIKNRHILSFNKNEKMHVDTLINSLLGNFSSDSSRFILPLINQLYITTFTNTKLIELAKENITEIKRISSECAEIITRITNKTALTRSQLPLPKEIKDLETFSILEEMLTSGSLNKKSLADWQHGGGKISTDDCYINSLLELQISVWLCTSQDKKTIMELTQQAERFLLLDINRYKEINPSILMFLCEKFMHLGLYLIAVKYIEPILPDEPWQSPLLESLLQALFLSEQNDLFFKKLALFSDDAKTELVWLLEAQMHERLQQNDEAISAVQAAIKIDNTNAYSWDLLLFLHQKKKTNKEDLIKLVVGIPEEVFHSYHEAKIPLLNSIAKYVDPNIAESVLVDWFVVNPNQLAKHLIDIHHNSLMNRTDKQGSVYLPKHCIKGIDYSDGFRKHKRILIRDVETEHPLFLNITSPLGKIVEKLTIGETIEDPYLGEISLTDETPAFVAAYQAAIKIRDQNNDGSDSFKLFELPSNEDNLLPYFEKIFRRYSNNKASQNPVLQNPNIPLCMRGNFTHHGDCFRAAYYHLTSTDTTQYIKLHDEGITEPEKVIIDIYTAIYLSLLGFVSLIEKKGTILVLSTHTKDILDSWIKDITREDYLSLDVTEFGMRRITAEDIKKNSDDFIQQLKLLINISKDDKINAIDTPEELLKIKDVIDHSIFSTIQLSHANNIPWLSIDHLLCILAQNSDFPVVNINSFLKDLINISNHEERKKSIIVNLTCGLPVPIFYNDIIILSSSHEKNDIYFVAKFIEKYKCPNNTTTDNLNYLSQIMRSVIIKAYLDRDILNGGRSYNPVYDGYEEYVFNVCCKTAVLFIEGATAETRVALLISETLKPFYHIRTLRELIFDLATSFSIGHFLSIEAINIQLERIIKSEKLPA